MNTPVLLAITIELKGKSISLYILPLLTIRLYIYVNKFLTLGSSSCHLAIYSDTLPLLLCFSYNVPYAECIYVHIYGFESFTGIDIDTLFNFIHSYSPS